MEAKDTVMSDEQIAVKVWEMAQSCIGQSYPAYKTNIVRQETLKWAVEAIQQAKEEVAREIFEEIEPYIIEALQAPTHEANDYNCEDWPPGEGCSGCKGDKLREEAIPRLNQSKSQHLKG